MGCKSCFRHPRTKNERTGYFATTWNEPGLLIRVRGRRRPRRLPTDYDDIWSPGHRNWKHFRRRQWKPVA
jgi:hypothetical protein